MSPIVPASLSAGLSLRLSISLPAYPGPAWQLTLVARGAGVIDLVAAPASGPDHVIEASAAATAGWAVGRYWYQLRASDGEDVGAVEDGSFEVMPDLAAAVAGHDGRGHVARVLEAIEAVIEGRASLDQQSYRINNRELVRTPLADLLELRSVYARKRSVELARRNGSDLLGRRVLTRFS